MFFKSQEYQKELKDIAEAIPSACLLKNKDILITGATGMIGSALVDVLLYLNKNYGYCIKVYALARDIKKLLYCQSPAAVLAVENQEYTDYRMAVRCMRYDADGY